jgi:hypothetical protein
MTIAWKDKLDKKYDIYVERDKPYHGFLVIKDGDNELLREETTISYDAIFCADLSDVNEWQNKGINFIDNFNKK